MSGNLFYTKNDLEVNLEKAFYDPSNTSSIIDVTYRLALTILFHYFGDEWTFQNLSHAKPINYLKYDDKIPKTVTIHTYNVIEFAENIINLQHVPGAVDKFVTIWKNTKQLEGHVNELIAGKLLAAHQIPFVFRKPGNSQGTRYDFDIFMPDGLILPCEVKKRISNLDFDIGKVTNWLKEGGDQLPKGQPGVLFAGVPEEWIKDDSIMKKISESSLSLLRNFTRLLTILYYGDNYDELYRDKLGMLIKEHYNNESEYAHLLPNGLTKGVFIEKMPDSWLSLIGFVIDKVEML